MRNTKTNVLLMSLFSSAFLLMPILAGENTQYGNCDTDGAHFSYAPDALVTQRGWQYMSVLSSNDYAQANWWPVYDTPPVVPTNMTAWAVGWKKNAFDRTREEIDWVPTIPPQTNEWGEIILVPVTNTVHYTVYTIERLYETGLKPVPPVIYRAWTPLTIMRGAKAQGFWSGMKQVLEANDAYDEFMACQYCAECDPGFVSIRAIIVAQIGEEATATFLDGLKVEKTGTLEELLETY